MRHPAVGLGLALAVLSLLTGKHQTFGADAPPAHLLVGKGASEPVSPASWYGEGVRPSDKRTPEEELAGFHLPDGFIAELVASEPKIAKPLNMAFDAKGKLWLTQTVEYPYPAKEGEVARDCVKTLEDTDGNGTFDRVITFADGLNVPIGILPYQQGAIVFSIPNIFYLRDTDDDGICDHREVILGPFDTTRDTHGMVNSLRRGDDGWIYACHGFNNQSVVKGRDGHEVRLTSGNTFRFRADGSRVELYTSGQVNPFGMTVDRNGIRITADCHSKPLTSLFPGACYPSFGRPDDGLGFYPAMMDHLHGSTAISGVSLYDATGFPAEYRHQIYSGNVMTSRINRDRLDRKGATMVATEIEDFLTSDDPWFRPVDIQLGPDGALYVADFYNRIIGHYEVPLEHPGRDRDSGRIWRIRHRDAPKTTLHVDDKEFRLETLLGELSADNITRRQLALDALTDIALKSEASEESLVKVATNRLRSDNELSQVGSLWLLHRLQRLDQAQLLEALQSDAPLVRAHSLRAVLESQSINAENISAALLAESRRLLNDDSPEIRSWAAMVLSRLGDASDGRRLAQLIADYSDDDSMLRARLRLALRDLIRRHSVILNELSSAELRTSEKQVYREMILGIESHDVVSPILKELTSTDSLRGLLPWIHHAVKCADDAQFSQLIETLRVRSSDRERSTDISSRELFLELRQVTIGRSSSALNAWVASFVKDSLSAVRQAANEGQVPIAWTATNGPAWAVEARQAVDQNHNARYRSSLTRGETYTGTMRSGDFSASGSLSFWLVGHNGFPGNDDHHLNRVRLLDSASGEVLQEAFPPRSDIAHPVTWDLTAWQGNSVRLEVIDGDAGEAYAWIAVGRFDHSALNPSLIEEEWTSSLSLIKSFKVESSRPLLQDLIASPTINRGLRLQALQCNADLCGHAAAAATAAMVLSLDVDEKLQDRCLEIATSERDALTAATAYRDIIRSIAVASAQREQLAIARELAANQELNPWLIEAWEEGWLAADLSHDKSVETPLESAISDDLRERLRVIKQSVSPVNEAAVAVAQAILRTSVDNDGNLKQGEAIFQKHCAVCHQLGGAGSLVGPQLDGVGVRGRERLLEDILFPDRNVDKAFRTVSLLMEDGSVRVGLLRSETPNSIELIDNAGKTHTLDAREVSSRRINGRSLMPDGHHETLGIGGMIDLLTYLEAKASSKTNQ